MLFYVHATKVWSYTINELIVHMLAHMEIIILMVLVSADSNLLL